MEIIILILIIALVVIFISKNLNKNILQSKFNKPFNPTHKVKLLTDTNGLSLRKEPDSKMDVFTKIENGKEIQHISTGDDLILGENKGFWYEIRTEENIYGWCFSGSLEKI